jgi:hypothetical protein
LRLQDEIGPDFTIDEPASDEARAKYVRQHAEEAKAAREKERVRRERKTIKQDDAEEESADQGIEETEVMPMVLTSVSEQRKPMSVAIRRASGRNTASARPLRKTSPTNSPKTTRAKAGAR